MTTNYTSPGGGSADEAKRKLEGAAETVKADVAAAKDDVAARAKSVAERRKETGAGHLDAFADAVRKAADELGEQDESAAAQFVREAAGGLESLSVSLREKSVGDLVDSVSRFGRSNPTAFLGGALLAGVALGRFAQSSGKRSHGAHDAGHGREAGMASTGSAMPSSPSGRPTASPGGTTGHDAAARPFPSAVNTGGTNDAIR
jgi:hypothetical protein